MKDSEKVLLQEKVPIEGEMFYFVVFLFCSPSSIFLLKIVSTFILLDMEVVWGLGGCFQALNEKKSKSCYSVAFIVII